MDCAVCGFSGWPESHNCNLSASTVERPVRPPGLFGRWRTKSLWVGVVRHKDQSVVWRCGHEHENQSSARSCTDPFLNALRDPQVPVAELTRPSSHGIKESIGMHAAVPGLTNTAWQEMLEIFSGRCRYCGDSSPLERDHRQPMSRGGHNQISNIVPACLPCNRAKSTDTEDEYLKKLRRMWGRRVRRKPRDMDRQLKELERKYGGEAAESRGETMLRSLSIPMNRWPGKVPCRAEVAIHRNREMKVAGSSFQMAALQARVASSDIWVGYAALIPEPSNSHDENAVGVHVLGRQIGYLPKAEARKVSGDLQRLLDVGTAVAARVKVFRSPKGIGARVKLDLPLKTRSP